MKYILVTGGVVSGLGKGIIASSIGVLLKANGLSVTSIKIDPYLNQDAGTMSPYEHGEVFVLADGGETDLDMGNYERFLDITLTSNHNITTGKIYSSVMARERRGDYLGKTVQVVPHVTDAIQEWIKSTAVVKVGETEPEVCIIELGGTIGDIESMVFLEALRQLRYNIGPGNMAHIHVSLIPLVGESKTKPTQHSIRELRAAGLSPDLIACRSPQLLSRAVIEKISLHCMVPLTHIFTVHDVPSLYHVPMLLLSQSVPQLLLNCLELKIEPVRCLPEWQRLLALVEADKPPLSIALVGKYNGSPDVYLSVIKALHHACLHARVADRVVWIDAVQLEADDEKAWSDLRMCACVIIPGGFGSRGIEGMIRAANYARTNDIPFLGICLGMQIAVIEYARNVMRINSDVIIPIHDDKNMGGTMRLGLHTTYLDKNSLAYFMYNCRGQISERHRHRYKVNPDIVDHFENGVGLIFSGHSDNGVEILEGWNHPFYFACQFHPEFQSRPLNPSPCFTLFIKTAIFKI